MKKVWETRGNLVMKLVSSLFQINFKSVRTPHQWTAFPKTEKAPTQEIRDRQSLIHKYVHEVLLRIPCTFAVKDLVAKKELYHQKYPTNIKKTILR